MTLTYKHKYAIRKYYRLWGDWYELGVVKQEDAPAQARMFEIYLEHQEYLTHIKKQVQKRIARNQERALSPGGYLS